MSVNILIEAAKTMGSRSSETLLNAKFYKFMTFMSLTILNTGNLSRSNQVIFIKHIINKNANKIMRARNRKKSASCNILLNDLLNGL